MIRILVLEDDDDLNHAVCLHLQAQGYEVTGCKTVEECYEVMDRQKIDLIISDIFFIYEKINLIFSLC